MIHPQALWALMLAIPIAIVFLYKGRRRPLVVPSLAIWRQALGPEGRPRGFTRLREWLLLAVNLGLLALLVGAASAPGSKPGASGADHWALVIDVSPSMAATDAGGRSRLDAARAEARALLDRLPAAAWVTLVSAGTEPVSLGPLPPDAEELRAALDALDWRPGPCRAETAWGSVHKHPDAAALNVVFFSDGAGVTGLDGFLRDARHWFVRTGGAAQNAAIVAAEIDRSWGDVSAELQLEFRAGADAPLRRDWVVALQGKEIARGAVEIPPGSPVTVSCAVPTYQSGLLEARLEPADDFALDDRAHLALAPLAKPWVWIVTDAEDSFLVPVLAALADHVDGKASGRARAGDFRPGMLPSGGVGIVAFDGADPPADLPPGNYLFFGSGGAHLPVRIGPVTESPSVARWASDHPLLRRAPLELLQVQRSRVVFPARGDQALVEGAGAILAAAGAGNGRAWAYFGFRLSDSNLPVLVAYPLLVKNVVSWFAGRRSWLFRPQYRCGEPPRLETDVAAPAVRLRRTDGSAEGTVPVSGRELVLDQALRPGWYAAEAGTAKGAFGVNLFDPGEVDVRATATATRVPVLPERGPQGPETPPWVRLALWALAVLGVEWLLFHAWKQ